MLADFDVLYPELVDAPTDDEPDGPRSQTAILTDQGGELVQRPLAHRNAAMAAFTEPSACPSRHVREPVSTRRRAWDTVAR